MASELCLTVTAGPAFGPAYKEREYVVIPIKLVVAHHDNELGVDFSINWHTPCERIRQRGEWGAINHLREVGLPQFESFGPISAQRIRHTLAAHIHQLGGEALRALAGPYPALEDAVPMGRA